MPLQSVRLYLHSLGGGTAPVPEGRYRVRPAGRKPEIEQPWGVSKEGRPQSAPLWSFQGGVQRGEIEIPPLVSFLGAWGAIFSTWKRWSPEYPAPWGQNIKNGPPRYTDMENLQKRSATQMGDAPLALTTENVPDLSPWRPSRSAPHTRRCRPGWRPRRRPRRSHCRPEPRRRQWSCR